MSQLSTTRRRYSVAAVLWLFLFLSPVVVSAIPISEYQQNLKRSITSLESLERAPEDTTLNDAQFDFVSNSVRTTLPEHQEVEIDGEVYNVDNTWLHKAIDELKQADQWREKLAQTLSRLQSIEARVAERQNPGDRAAENKEWDKTRLESILARPDYTDGPQGSSAIARLLRDFAQWLEKWLPKRRAVSPGRIDLINLIARIVVIALATLLLLYVLKTVLVWYSGRSRKEKTGQHGGARIVLGERLEADATASDLLSEAEALARQGELRAAIRKAYIALLVELGDRKVISLAHHKTNRDYLNALRSTPQLHSRMRGLTESFERHWYGFANATPNDWQDFRAGYLAALQTDTK
jgi:hypothetical protein